MVSKQTIRPYKSKVLFTLVSGAVLINPAFAQEQATEELEEIVVTGLRGSLDASREIKRNAMGVVDAITAEDIGKFPDTNLAESLQRITGVSIDRRNGEGALVTARGFGPQFNMVTLNGRQMPGADGYGGGNPTTGGAGAGTRSFNFANLAAEAISGVEVYKTGRADIATGGIGATVNIKTARPFDNAQGFLMNLGAKALNDTTSRIDDVTPEVSGIFSYTNDSRTWGVGLNASYSKRASGSVQATVNEWNIQPWSAVDSVNQGLAPLAANAIVENAPAEGQLYGIPNDIRYAFSDLERERVNGQAVVQFAPTDALTLTLDYTMASNEIAEDRGEQTVWMQRNGFTHIIFDTGEAVATPIYLEEHTGGQKDYGFEQQRNEQEHTLSSVGFNADWQVTDRFNLAFDFHDSTAESNPNDPITGGSATAFSLAGVNCPLSGCEGYWTQTFWFNEGLPIAGRTFYPSQADAIANTNGDPDYVFTDGQLASQVMRIGYQQQQSDVTQARLDGAFEFDNGRFQFGLETRSADMHQRTSGSSLTMGNWSGNDAGGIPGMVALLEPFSIVGEFEDWYTTGAPTTAFRANANQLGLWAINEGVSPVPNQNGRRYNNWDQASAPDGQLRFDPGFNNNNLVEEDIRAIYIQFAVQGELGTMPTNLLLGARYEETEVTSTAQILIPSDLVWYSNNDWRVNRATEQSPFSEEADYSNLLPSLDFDIGLTDSLKGRFSYSKTIARANYPNLYTGATVGTPGGSTLNGFQAAGAANNPSLVPLESDNLDLAMEWYFSDSGYLSVGFWEKRVANFIGNTVVNGPLFGLRDPSGGPDAQFVRNFLTTNGYAPDDTNMFTALVMYRYAAETGGLAAFDGSIPQANAMEVFAGNLPNGGLVATADDPIMDFGVNRPVNTEEAKIHGWEFGGQYFFGDTGFGVLANYTVVRGDVSFDDTASPSQNQFALLGLSDSANLVLMYENFGFTARLAYNWRDEFLSLANFQPFRNPIYVEEYDQVDLSLGYEVNHNLAISLEGINLLGEDTRWHGRSTKQVWRLEEQGPRYAFGARYKF